MVLSRRVTDSTHVISDDEAVVVVLYIIHYKIKM